MTTIIGTDIDVAANFLKAGELVAIPTETVYGLAANALDETAVLKIFTAKNRPQFNPLIIHLASWQQAAPYIKQLPEVAEKLARHFMPGPLTLLLPKSILVPDLVTAGSDKVAIRVPNHPIAQQLLQQLSFPLAAPSANLFGYVSPVTAMHVYEGLQGRISYILDGGSSEVGLESSIVDIENNEVIIRRTGSISRAAIEACLGKKVMVQTASSHHPVAPGMLRSHYATHTPLYMGELNALNEQFEKSSRLLLGWGSIAEIAMQANIGQADENVCIHSLSLQRQLDEVARQLFTTMRWADTQDFEVILVAPFPDEGVGIAINDRLKRAQHSNKE